MKTIKSPIGNEFKEPGVALEPRVMLDGAALAAFDGALDGAFNEVAAVDDDFQSDQVEKQSVDDLVESLAVAPTSSDRREIVFVDISVVGYESILSELGSHLEVVLLRNDTSGVEQIEQALADLGDQSPFDAIHIISHGSAGVLHLGASTLDAESMVGENSDALQSMSKYLASNADLLIYGCNFAEGEVGQSAARLLSELTGADVAASDDATGTELRGADWELEVHEGEIESSAIRSASFAGVLAVDATDSILTIQDSDNPGAGTITLVNDGDSVSVTTVGAPSRVGQMIDRVWTYDETADVGGSTLVFDINAVAGVLGAETADFGLIIGDRTDFLGTTRVLQASGYDAGNGLVYFHKVNLAPGEFITLATQVVIDNFSLFATAEGEEDTAIDIGLALSPALTDGGDLPNVVATDVGYRAEGTTAATEFLIPAGVTTVNITIYSNLPTLTGNASNDDTNEEFQITNITVDLTSQTYNGDLFFLPRANENFSDQYGWTDATFGSSVLTSGTIQPGSDDDNDTDLTVSVVDGRLQIAETQTSLQSTYLLEFSTAVDSSAEFLGASTEVQSRNDETDIVIPIQGNTDYIVLTEGATGANSDFRVEWAGNSRIVLDLNTLTASGVISARFGEGDDRVSAYGFSDYDISSILNGSVQSSATLNGDSQGNNRADYDPQFFVRDTNSDGVMDELVIRRDGANVVGEHYTTLLDSLFSAAFYKRVDVGSSGAFLETGYARDLFVSDDAGTERVLSIDVQESASLAVYSLSIASAGQSDLNDNNGYGFAVVNFDTGTSSGYLFTNRTTSPDLVGWSDVAFGDVFFDAAGSSSNRTNLSQFIDKWGGTAKFELLNGPDGERTLEFRTSFVDPANANFNDYFFAASSQFFGTNPFEISGFPADGTFDKGGFNPDTGNWELTVEEAIAGLAFVPNSNFSGATPVDINVQIGDEIETTLLTVTAVIDPISFDTPSAIGDEDTNISLALAVAPTFVDDDGSETLTSVQLSGVPVGHTISDGTNSFTATVGSTTLDITAWDRTMLEFQPAENVSGTFTISIAVDWQDAGGGVTQTNSAVDTFDVVINAVNDLPVAVNDNYITVQNTDVIAMAGVDGVLVNDTDADGPTLSVNTTPVSGPSDGILILSASGSFTYTPTPGFVGTDSFVYEVSDGGGGTAQGTVSIQVSAVPAGPLIATDDAETTDEETPVNVVVLGNDTLPVVGAITISSTTAPGNGSIVLNADNSIDYTPNTDFFGTDTFTYTVEDAGNRTSTATVTITVSNVNDAPIALPNSGNTGEDVPLTIDVLGNDSDVDGDMLTVATATSLDGAVVINGDGSLTFTPSADFNGTATINYTINDGNGEMASSVVSVNVTSAPDAPTSADKTILASEDVEFTFQLSDFAFADADVSDLLQDVRIDSLPGSGVLLLAGVDVIAGQVIVRADIVSNLLVFKSTPEENGVGYANFNFSVGDGFLFSATPNVITIDVAAVADAPEASSFSRTTNLNTDLVFVASDFPFTDAEGDALESVRIDTVATDGSLLINGAAAMAGDVITVADIALGRLVFRPDPGESGDGYATFTFSVITAGQASVESKIATINVNAPAVAIDDFEVGVTNNPTTVDVAANDTDIDGTAIGSTVVITSNPVGSTLAADGKTLTVPGQGVWVVSVTTGAISFTPEAGFTADPDSINYTIEDDDGAVSNTATVTVDYAIQLPIANDDSGVAGSTNVNVTVDVLANDVDPDGTLETSTVQITSNPVGSTLAVDGKTLTVPGEGVWTEDGAGNITFDPDVGFTDDPTSITYTVADNDANVSNEGTVRIDYPPFGPTVSDDTISAVALGPVTLDVLANDLDDGTIELSTVKIISSPVGSTLSADGKTLTVPGQGVWQVDDNAISPTFGQITFTPEAGFLNDPDPISYTVDDNDGNVSNPGVVTIDYIVSPVLDLNDDGTTPGRDFTGVYTEGTGAGLLDAAASILDNDTTSMQTATVVLTNFQSGDLLLVDGSGAAGGTTNGIAYTITYNVSDITISFNGAATQAAYLAAFSAVTFDSTSDQPIIVDRQFTLVVNDGESDSNTANATLTITAVNDAPTVVDAELTVVEASVNNQISNLLLRATDVDDVADDLVFTITTLVINGTLLLDGTQLDLNDTFTQADVDAGRLAYTHDGSETIADQFAYSVSDGEAAPINDIFAILVTPINDPPVVVDSAVTTDEDTDRPINASDLTFTDVENDSLAQIRIDSLPVLAAGQLLLSGAPLGVGSIVSQLDIISGNLVFRPAANVNGIDLTSFTYSVHDGTEFSDTPGTVTITVTPVNDDARVLNPIPDQTDLDSDVVSFATAGFFSDLEGDTLTFSVSSLPAGLSIDAGTGLITGQIAANASTINSGNYAVTVSAADPGGVLANNTFTWAIANPAPALDAAIPDRLDLDSDDVILDISTYFTDEGDTLVFSATGLPPGLTLDAATGILTGTLTSTASLTSPYTVTVTANDEQGGVTSDVFVWTIGNQDPVVANPLPDRADVEGQAISLDVTDVFANPDNDPLTYSATGLPAGLSIDTLNGVITGALTNASAGIFTVTVSANDGLSSTSDVFIWTITNPAPTLVTPIVDRIDDDSTSVSFDISSSFVDPDSDTAITFSATGLPTGILIDSGTGLISGNLASNASQSGPYTVTVTATDSDGDATIDMFFWTVNNTLPTAADRITSVIEDGTINEILTGLISDLDGDTHTHTVVTGPANGFLSIAANGEYTYTADPDFFGQDVFTYQVDDGDGGIAQGTVTINVISENDIPRIVSPIPAQIGADNDTINLPTSVFFTDVEGDTLTYSAVGLPSGLTIDAATGIISGVLLTNASTINAGSYAVTVRVADSSGILVGNDFIWTVTNPAPVLDTTFPDRADKDADDVLLDVSGFFTDEGDTLIYSVTGLPVGLSIDASTGLISGTLAANASTISPYSVTVTADDQQGGVTSDTFVWDVANQNPFVSSPTPDQVDEEGTSVSIDVTQAFSNPDGDTLTYTVTGLPANLNFNVATGLISGVIDNVAAGTYNISVTADDGTAVAVDDFVWTITNPAPVIVTAIADRADLEGTAISFDASTGFTDPDGDTVTYSATSLPTGLSIDSVTGVISGAIDNSAAGTYTVTVTANDGADSTPDSFVWTITNPAPVVLSPIADRTDNDAAGVSFNASLAFSDPDGDAPISYSAVGLPSGISIDSLTGVVSGTISSSASTTSPYIVTITADDGEGGIVNDSLVWTVVNVAPVAGNSAESLDEDTSYVDTVSGLVSDADADDLTFSVINPVSNGTLMLLADGSYTYTPNTDYNGPDTFTYEVSDGEGGTAQGIVTLNISVVNDLPIVVSPLIDRANNDGAVVMVSTAATFSDVDGDLLNYSATGLPAGVTIDSGTGIIAGTIAADASVTSGGSYSVSVSVNDASGTLVTSIFTWSISNTAPILDTPAPDRTDLDGAAISLNIASFFVDEGDTLVFTATGLPNGLSIDSATGIISGNLVPEASDTSPYLVTIGANDQQGGLTTDTFTWTINNVAPTISSPLVDRAVDEGATISIDTSAAFSDTDGDVLTYSVTGLPLGLSFNMATGLISGVIDNSAAGSYTVSVTANDGSDVITDSFVLTVSNPAPVVATPLVDRADDDAAVVSFDASLAFSDPDGDTPITYSALNLPPGLTINVATGVISGTISSSASVGGPYSVTVTADDGEGGVTSDVFDWVVSNIAPTAADTTETTLEDTALNATASSLVLDADGDSLSFTVVTTVSDGTLTMAADGSYTYTPAANFTGQNTFVYEVSDGEGGVAQGTITINITAENDQPQVINPLSDLTDDDGDVVSLGTAVAFTDVDGDTLTYSVTGLPAGLSIDAATGLISGTIAVNASTIGGGSYSVSVSVDDGSGTLVSSSFNWLISNPAPILDAPASDRADLDADDVILDLSTLFTDEGDVLVYSVSGLPPGLVFDTASGIVSGTLSPTASLTSPYTVTITADDQQGGVTFDDFVWTVGNQDPTVANPIADMNNNEGDAISFDTTAAFENADGDTLTYTAAGLPPGLNFDTATGLISGVIDSSAVGSYNVIITADDGTAIATDNFVWTIGNPAPVLDVALTDRTDSDSDTVSFDVSGNFTDPDGDTPLTYSVSGLPSGVTINAANGLIAGTIDSSASSFGPFTVSVTVDDGEGGAVTGSFIWTVLNTLPTAADTAETLDEDTSLFGSVAGLIADVDNDALSLSVVSPVANGSLSLALDGTYTYTPDSDFNGTDAFTYQVTDSDGATAMGIVTLNVSAVNDLPVVATVPADRADNDGDTVSFSIAANFSDIDGDTLSFAAIGLPSGITIDPNTGVISGSIDADASTFGGGSYVVTISATDASGTPVTTDFTWQISNLAPVLDTAASDRTDLDSDTVTLDLSTLFSDEGDTLVYSITGLPPGLSIDAATGVVSGTLTATASNTSPFTVTITVDDQQGGVTADSFVWTVNNQDPTVANPSVDIANDEGDAISIDSTQAFANPDGDTLTYSATGLPPGLIFNTTTGLISGVIGDAAAGSYTVTITADDGTAVVSDNFVWTISNPSPVVVTPISDRTDADSDAVSFSISTNFIDPDADTPLVYSATGLPAGITIDAATGLISGSVDSSASLGSRYTVNVSVDDGQGGLVTDSFEWTITNIDPTVTPLALSGDEDIAITGDLKNQISDADGDTITFTTLVDVTDGILVLSGDGAFTYTPDADFFGIDTLTYQAVDGEGGVVTSTVTFTINPINDLPQVQLQLPDRTDADAASIALGTATFFSDVEGDSLTYAAQGLPAGLTIDVATGLISGQILADASVVNGGIYNVVVSVQDGDLISVSNNFVWTVTNPAPVLDSSPPDRMDLDGDDVLFATATFFSDEGDVLLYSASGLPDGLSIDTSTGLVSGTLTATASLTSPYNVVMTANDQQGGLTSDTFVWTIGNQDPTVASPLPDINSSEGDSISIDTTSAFENIDGDVLTYSISGLPASLNFDTATGLISGIIDNTAANIYIVMVTADDGTAAVTDTFIWTITNPAPLLVTPIVDQANNDSASISIDISAAFTDPDGDVPVTYSVDSVNVLPPGLTIDAATGVISGTIAANASQGSPYSVTITANDGDGGSTSDTFSWVVSNIAPIAIDGNETILEDNVLVGALAGLVTDSDGDPLSFSVFTGPSNGALMLNGDGTYSYTPNADYFGADSFVYEVSDGDGGTDQATITLDVQAVNDLPTVVTPFANRADNDGDVVTFPSAANFTDVEGDTLTFSATGLPTGISINSVTGVVSGTIAADASTLNVGSYAIDIAASDASGIKVISSFVWTISNVAPVLDSPALDRTDFDGSAVLLDLSTLFIDEGDTLVFSITGQPPGLTIDAATGVVSGTLTATASIGGPYTSIVTADDLQGGTVSDTFIWSVDNQDPSIADPFDDMTSDEGVAISFDATQAFANPDGDTLTYSATFLPPGLSINSATGLVSGVIDNSVAGTYVVSITANDGTASVTDDFIWEIVNPSPVATPLTLTTDEDVSLTGTLADQVFDADGDALSFTTLVGAANGVVTIADDGTFTYTPNLNFVGQDSFTYSVSDGEGGLTQGTVTISVDALNDPPQIVQPLPDRSDFDGNNISFNTAEFFTDSDGEVRSYSAQGLPPGLTINTSTGEVTGRIDASASTQIGGVYSTTISVQDDAGGIAADTFVWQVLNTVPVAIDGFETISEDSQFIGTLSPLVSDDDGDALSYRVVSPTSNGTLTIEVDGRYTYTPLSQFFGEDEFVYEVTDGEGGVAQATVNITVTDRADIITPVPFMFESAEPRYVNQRVTVGIDFSSRSYVTDAASMESASFARPEAGNETHVLDTVQNNGMPNYDYNTLHVIESAVNPGDFDDRRFDFESVETELEEVIVRIEEDSLTLTNEQTSLRTVFSQQLQEDQLEKNKKMDALLAALLSTSESKL